MWPITSLCFDSVEIQTPNLLYGKPALFTHPVSARILWLSGISGHNGGRLVSRWSSTIRLQWLRTVILGIRPNVPLDVARTLNSNKQVYLFGLSDFLVIYNEYCKSKQWREVLHTGFIYLFTDILCANNIWYYFKTGSNSWLCTLMMALQCCPLYRPFNPQPG